VLLALSGCAPTAATGDTPAASARGAELERQIEALRVRLAGDPADAGLHLALARALDQAGRPGGAIRHYQEVLRHRRLDGNDRRALGRLLVARGEARLGLGEGDAWRDVHRARGLGREAAPALAREALFAGALAGLRRADGPGRERAGELLARAARLAPGDARLAVLDPERAELAALAAAAAWLADGGARRAALDLYREYVAKGGREPEHARRYLVLHRWWYGDRQRPSGLLLHQLAAAGVDLCGLARTADEPGCGAALVAGRADGPLARRRAARLGWRTADPPQAARWVDIALAAWLDGEVPSWTEEVRARVDLVALERAAGELPPYAAATLLRAAGKSGRAAAALDRVAARAAELTAEERTVAVAEAAEAGRSDELVDRLLASGATLDGAWRAALRVAREREPGGAREAALLDRAPPAVAASHLRAAGELGALAARDPSLAVAGALERWRAALDHARLQVGRDAALARWRGLAGDAPERLRPARVLPLGAIDPHRIAADRELSAELDRIARAYLRSPAAAERLAGDFVDGAPAVGERGPSIAALYLALGDPARAWAWAERVLRSSPDHAPYLMAAGVASVATGAVDRADIFFIEGAQASGDAGSASVTAARTFLARGHALAAATASRRAVQLTAAGQPEHDEAVSLAARALDQLGRADAARALRASERVAPDRPRPAIRFPPVDSAAWQAAIADTLARALLAPPEEAARLLSALADELDGAGLHVLAGACRREARSLAL
jgi:hypothetical protein